MSEPQTKKQKTSPHEAPIVFTVRTEKPDVRMYVFDKEFHVYSGVLKAGSGFFAAYLNPSGGIAPSSTSPLFDSDWFTAIDEDGTWHLSSNHGSKDADLTRFKGDRDCETTAFNNLLSALFSRECRIVDAKDLSTLTEQADYYRALPVVSNNITPSLVKNPLLISKNPCAILKSAYKLRHKALFKDSLIFSLGPWSRPRYTALEHAEPELYAIANAVRAKFSTKLETFWVFLLKLAGNRVYAKDLGINSEYYDDIDGLDAVNSFFSQAMISEGSEVDVPRVFRGGFNRFMASHSLIAEDDAWKGTDWLADRLRPFMKNNLSLNNDVHAGEDEFGDHFFCFDIKDEDLPWDLAQTDW